MSTRVAELIDRWRALERELAGADPDGDRYAALESQIERVRREYRRVMASAIATTDQLEAASRESFRRVARSAEIAAGSLEKIRNTKRMDGD